MSKNIPWPETADAARRIQEVHKKYVRIEPLEREPALVAGADAAFSERSVYAAACLYRYPEMTLLDRTTVRKKTAFPYAPGYLFFLEAPALIASLRMLVSKPDVVLIDGQGTAHPRGIGSASHLGVVMNMPAIGCAKTRFVGKFREPGNGKGEWSELEYEGKTVGAVLRTKDRVRPLFVSPGHGVDLADSIRIVLGCVTKYRIPEPLRCADALSRRFRDGKI